ncbi:MAG TPA: response regulator [Microcoleaceae bacterium UBA11344]|jgi:chemotaxis family two-component system response regulator Rcp1|nr:response regulator [Microcoleaceae cyanobacterium UBA11344]
MSDLKIVKPIEILLVEDSPSDADFAVESFADSQVFNNLHLVEDGVEAMSFLKQEGLYVDAPRPDVILLDLNLPKKSGLEVLAEINSDPLLRTIPVVIMTISSADAEILKAYSLSVSCYITKPVDLTHVNKVVRLIEDVWRPIMTEEISRQVSKNRTDPDFLKKSGI